MHAAGGLFLPAFGQPHSVGRWCRCPFQMGFKSSPVSCQLPHIDIQDRRQKTPRGSAIFQSSSHTPLRSTQAFLLWHTFSVTSSLIYSFSFDFFLLSFIPTQSVTRLPGLLLRPAIFPYLLFQSLSGCFTPPFPLRPHPHVCLTVPGSRPAAICQHLFNLPPARACVTFP